MPIEKHLIVTLEMEMIKRFGVDAMRRGWNAYQAGKVADVKIGDTRVTAQVTDQREACEVCLAFDSFERSRCACGSKTYCHHMAALFFQLYAAYEKRPELFLMQHRKMKLHLRKERENRKKKVRKELVAHAEEQCAYHPVGADDPVANWYLDIVKRFSESFSAASFSPESVLNELRDYASRISGGWPSPSRELYMAFAHLFMLGLAENRYASFSPNYVPKQTAAHFRQLFHECADHFCRFLGRVSIPTDDGGIFARILELAGWLHHRVFRADDRSVEWMEVYRAFCWKLGEWPPQALQQEKRRLSDALRDEQMPLNRRRRLMMGLLHIELIEGGAEALPRLLRLIAESGELEHVFAYVDRSMRTNDWSRAKLILDSMLPHVREHPSDRVKVRYLDCWKNLLPHTDCQDQWRDVLKSLLPHSMEIYEQMLVRAGDYRSWVDLQMASGRGPNEVNRETVAVIEMENVELLLPFYHQAVHRAIAERKRESYKKAVEFMIRLAAYYDRIGEKDRFQAFLTQLRKAHGTLRALMEELRRSRLIT